MVRSDELSRKGEQAKAHLNGKAQSYSEELSRFLKAY
jgi:hypothetical protein